MPFDRGLPPHAEPAGQLGSEAGVVQRRQGALVALEARASRASHRPSGACTLAAMTTWVCSCGSPARLVCWRNTAAVNPARRRPSTWPSALGRGVRRGARRSPRRPPPPRRGRPRPAARRGGADGEQHRHRLRRRTRHVEASHRLLAVAPAAHARCRSGRSQPSRRGTPPRRRRRPRPDSAGTTPQPPAGRLAGVEVVAGRRLDVVAARIGALERRHPRGHRTLPLRSRPA